MGNSVAVCHVQISVYRRTEAAHDGYVGRANLNVTVRRRLRRRIRCRTGGIARFDCRIKVFASWAADLVAAVTSVTSVAAIIIIAVVGRGLVVESRRVAPIRRIISRVGVAVPALRVAQVPRSLDTGPGLMNLPSVLL